jgi:hypothetical protein
LECGGLPPLLQRTKRHPSSALKNEQRLFGFAITRSNRMIVVTGATGNTGKPAVEALLANGEKVRVIGRDAFKLEPFVKHGAEPLVGSVEDPSLLQRAFQGATAAYILIPPDMNTSEFRAYQDRLVDLYAAAIAETKIPYVVTLSSIGADQPQKTGPILGLRNLETKLNAVPGLNVLHLRPAGFMENLFMSVQPLLGQRDVTMKEVASIVGSAIGKPKLGYMQVPFMMLEPALVQTGIQKPTAALMIEMWKSMNSGAIKPLEPRNAKNTTPTSIETFVAEVFAPAYMAMSAKA